MKRILLKILTLALIAGIFACASSSGLKFNPGTYQGTAAGFGGDITTEVTVDAGRILSIKIVSQNDTPEISKEAFDRIPKAIISGQTLAVDTVSGATFSSDGIINAVTAALQKSGVDIAALKNRKPGAGEAVQLVSKSDSADVVVIGAGGAGLSAAVSAHQNGAKVIILEKMTKAGGNTINCGTAYNTADPARQAAVSMTDAHRASIQQLITKSPAHSPFETELQQTVKKQYDEFVASGKPGIFDSPEWHMLQTYNGGDYLGKPELIRVLAGNSLATLEWLQSNGMEWTNDIWTVLGALWPRTHRPVKPLGTGFIETNLKYLEAQKDRVVILYDTKATELIVQNGRVTGVKATAPGVDYTFTATKGLVIATGGFSANKEMRQKFNTQWPNLDNASSTNHTGATGDGIIMAEAIGANLVGMEWIQLLPMGDPKTGSLSGNIEQGVEDRFFVNKNGDRFMNEAGRRDDMTKALFAQPDAWMWVICDSQSYPTPQVKNNFNESIEELINAGRAFGGNTIEELASKIGVPAANLRKATDDFNAGVAAGKDSFGRSLWRIKIDKPPYYAGARIPTVHHTMGGIEINTDTQVINKSGQIIPGLYAAGEATGGIHGANRLGGNAVADIHTFGRIAGANAALAR